jgi:hypothetical protein
MLQATATGEVVPLPLLVDPPLLGCLLAWNLVLASCFFFFHSPKYLIVVAMLQFTTIKLIWAEEEVYIMAEENTGICAIVFSFQSTGCYISN